jgi:hypothetical protein
MQAQPAWIAAEALKHLNVLNDLNVCANTRPTNTFVDVGAGRALPLHRRTTSPHHRGKQPAKIIKITVQTTITTITQITLKSQFRQRAAQSP